MTSFRAIFGSTCLFLCFGLTPLRAGENPVKEEQVRELVAQLGDPSFKVRDAAQSRLLALGVAIRPILQSLAPIENAEARRRIDHVLKVFYQRDLARVRIIGVGFYTTNFGRMMPRSDVFAVASQLIASRKKSEPSPAKRIWELLDPFMKKTLEDESTVKLLAEKPYVAGATATAASRKLHLDLRRSLEKVLESPNLYDKQSFVKSRLPAEAKAMLARREKLSPLEARWLNYALASSAFPDLLHSASEGDANGIVRIQVPASTQPIVLVLSAYESSLWRIEAHPKSNLLHVVVGGYYPQEATGVKAPITYRVNQSLPLVRRNPDYFYAYTTTSATYRKMENSLQQMFGKGLDHFHGVRTYDGSPVVIDPNQ